MSFLAEWEGGLESSARGDVESAGPDTSATPQWLSTRSGKQLLNVLPNPLRQHEWLRNPPKPGAELADDEYWPSGGVRRVRVPVPTAAAPDVKSSCLCRLEIEVLSMAFEDHERYNEENRLARCLVNLKREHALTQESSRVDRAKKQIEAIKMALTAVSDEGQHTTYRAQLKALRTQIDDDLRQHKMHGTSAALPLPPSPLPACARAAAVPAGCAPPPPRAAAPVPAARPPPRRPPRVQSASCASCGARSRRRAMSRASRAPR